MPRAIEASLAAAATPQHAVVCIMTNSLLKALAANAPMHLSSLSNVIHEHESILSENSKVAVTMDNSIPSHIASRDITVLSHLSQAVLSHLSQACRKA